MTVPNVTGQTLDQAKQNLEAAGYKVGNVTKTWDSSKGKDRVLSNNSSKGNVLHSSKVKDHVLSSRDNVHSTSSKGEDSVHNSTVLDSVRKTVIIISIRNHRTLIQQPVPPIILQSQQNQK